MYNYECLDDIRNLELFLGIVPEFSSGPCDKTLEGYEGRPFPNRLRIIPKELEEDFPLYKIRYNLQSKEIEIISVEEIIAKMYSDEIGFTELEEGFNKSVHYF